MGGVSANGGIFLVGDFSVSRSDVPGAAPRKKAAGIAE